jgi:hypothetical protein
MLVIQKAALMLAAVVGVQPAVSGGPGPEPAANPAAVTVRQVLTMQALVGETVVVTGRCLGKGAPTVAKGSQPLSGGAWQIEDSGVAAWVTGPMPEGCDGGSAVITARVAQDTLPRLSPARTLRQYLVVR